MKRILIPLSILFLGAAVKATLEVGNVSGAGVAASITSGSTVVSGGTQGSVLFVSTAGVVGQNNGLFYWDEVNSHLLIFDRGVTAGGNFGAPTYSFVNDTNTGIGDDGGDNVFISAGGQDIAEFQGAGINNQRIYGAGPSAGIRGDAPSRCAYTRDVNAPTNGMFFINNGSGAGFSWSGNVGFSASSTWIMTLTSGGVGISTASPQGLLEVGGGTFTALSTGFVGISTETPTERFQINGVGTTYALKVSTDQANAPVALGVYNAGNVRLAGTKTNDSAAVGDYGEIISTGSTAFGNLASSTQFGNIVSVSYTAGNWSLSACVTVKLNGAAMTDYEIAVSSFSANTTTDHVEALNWIESPAFPTAGANSTACVPFYNATLYAPTTFYLKVKGTYTVATPQALGQMYGRRAR